MEYWSVKTIQHTFSFYNFFFSKDKEEANDIEEVESKDKETGEPLDKKPEEAKPEEEMAKPEEKEKVESKDEGAQKAKTAAAAAVEWRRARESASLFCLFLIIRTKNQNKSARNFLVRSNNKDDLSSLAGARCHGQKHYTAVFDFRSFKAVDVNGLNPFIHRLLYSIHFKHDRMGLLDKFRKQMELL